MYSTVMLLLFKAAKLSGIFCYNFVLKIQRPITKAISPIQLKVFCSDHLFLSFTFNPDFNLDIFIYNVRWKIATKASGKSSPW